MKVKDKVVRRRRALTVVYPTRAANPEQLQTRRNYLTTSDVWARLYPLCDIPAGWSSLFCRWREIRVCNDNACGESKRQNSHDSLLDSHACSLLLPL